MEGLATFLSDASTAVTSLQTSATSWLSLALEEPALFVMVIGIPLCYFGIRVVQRLFNLN